MPFEPRILPSDDADPERDRRRSEDRPSSEQDRFESSDLELLASQLSDDAAYLAQLYPPGSVRTRPAVVRRAWTAARADLWRLVAAAAVLLMLGVGGPFGVWLVQNRGEADGGAEQVVVSDGVTFKGAPLDGAANDPLRTASSNAENPIQAETGTAGLVQTILSGELSPSEQEAVFDLLEDEPTELARVSL